MKEKITLVLGASPKAERYSNRAVKTLKNNNIPVIAVGRREYIRDGFTILKAIPNDIGPVHTVSLYLNAENQKEYYDQILLLSPERVIFNPGATNPEFEEILAKEEIEVVTDCMLAMLACRQF
jgi:predicted CoA-binding protein